MLVQIHGATPFDKCLPLGWGAVILIKQEKIRVNVTTLSSNQHVFEVSQMPEKCLHKIW